VKKKNLIASGVNKLQGLKMLVGAISGTWRIPITNTTEESGLHLAMAVATRAVDMKADTMTADTPHPPVLREMITTAITEILGHRGAPAAVTEGAVSRQFFQTTLGTSSRTSKRRARTFKLQ